MERTEGNSRTDPEALAVAYDAIRDGEFNGIPATEIAKALMKASVNLRNDGYDTLGSVNDPGTWESIRTGERVEKHGECPICEWRHSYEILDREGGETVAFCPRIGVVESE